MQLYGSKEGLDALIECKYEVAQKTENRKLSKQK